MMAGPFEVRVHPPGVTAFAPATVANLGLGFDVLGLALAGVGDRVTARLVPGTEVRMARITGDHGALPMEAPRNTAGIAAIATLRKAGVQVMVEGPGHVPFNQIQMNMEREQKICDGAPFYVLGPVVTDIAPGYDHITSCIGATAATFYGASLLCYVTPAEHLGLPDEDEVHQGVIAYRIAAHAGDVARGLKGARDRDDAMSRARVAFDWKKQFELALDGPHAKARWEKTRVCTGKGDDDHCSMCGPEFCAMRTTQRIRDGK